MTAFFWLFAVLAVAAALLAITRRNGVAAALWVALAFVGIAAQFVLMRAYFLAAVEVLVYAGAIMVLFLFVIMLLNLDEKEAARLEGPRLHVAGVVLAALFLTGLVFTVREAGLFEVPIGSQGSMVPAGETGNVARDLFLEFLLPFEIASFLLLAAIVGAVLITKRRLT